MKINFILYDSLLCRQVTVKCTHLQTKLWLLPLPFTPQIMCFLLPPATNFSFGAGISQSHLLVLRLLQLRKKSGTGLIILFINEKKMVTVKDATYTITKRKPEKLRLARIWSRCSALTNWASKPIGGWSSLRSRRLEVTGVRENGRTRGRHARGECLLFTRAFFLVPTTSKRLLRRLGLVIKLAHKSSKNDNEMITIIKIFIYL